LSTPTGRCRLAALAAHASSHQERASVRIEVGLAERERFAFLKPARQSTTMTPRSRSPSGSSPAAGMTAMISSTVAAGTEALVAGWEALVEAREHCRRTAPLGAVQ
jgi:hypothetical protein